MQRIIKNGQILDETWHLLPKDTTLDQLSNCDDLIVPLALWVEHSTALKARDGGLGVWLDAGEEIEEIADQLDNFQVIALNFPAFTDGRHCSSACLLRTRYGYKGELRATGEVLVDMLPLLQRTGFDAVVLRGDQKLDIAQRLLASFPAPFPAHYQGDVLQHQPLFARTGAEQA